MMTAFHLIETRMLQEIYNIRLVLSQILHPNYNHLQHNQFMFPPMNLHPTLFHNINPQPITSVKPVAQSTTEKSTVIDANKTANSISNILLKEYTQNILVSTTPSSLNAYNSTPTLSSTTTPVNHLSPTTPKPNLYPLLKSLPLPPRKNGPRDFEIYKFNNTILAGHEIQVFTYFWKIENYTEKMRKNATDLFSPAFVISGFNLRLKASLNHLNRDYLYLRLEETPKNYTSSSSSVVLETGGGDDLFHEIETAKMFRHKIIVLDQSAKKSDLISQEFSDTASGFMIPSSALTSTDTYIKDNVILIKVILYL